MKRIAICLMVAGMALGWAATTPAQAPDLASMDLVLKSVPDGPVARVNGESIDAKEFRGLYRSEVERWIQTNGGQSAPDTVRIGLAIATMRSLVEQELLRQEAIKRKLSVADEELQKAYLAEIEAMQKALSRGDAKFSEAQVLEKAGTTKEEALKELRKGLLIQKVRELLTQEAKVTVTDKEIVDFFEANKAKVATGGGVHLQQIFVGATGAAKRNQARDKAANALQRIRAGQSFEAIARDVSEGAGKDKGGDIGLVPMNALPPFLTDAVKKLQPGQMSDVIESEHGFHIVKVLEITPGEEPSLEKMTPLIRRRLLEGKSEQVIAKFCRPSLQDEKVVQEFLLRELQKQMEARPELLEALKKGVDAKGAEAKGAESKSTETKSMQTKDAAPTNTKAKGADAKAKAPAPSGKKSTPKP